MLRDLPVLTATIRSGGAGRHLLGALPSLRGRGDASPPPAEMRSALEGLYAAASKPGPRLHFMVAADPTAELSDDAVALVADVAQFVPPRAMMLPREGWEGQTHNQTPAALLIARYVELGGSEAAYLERSETPGMRHWTAYHLLAPDMRLTVDPLDRPVVAGAPPQWPYTWDMAVRTMRMAPTGQRAEWPGAENLLATAQAAKVQQPADNSKDCGVCVLMSALGTLLRVPRPGNLLSTPDRRWVAAVGGGGGPSTGTWGPSHVCRPWESCPLRCWRPYRRPARPCTLADVPHHVGLPAAMGIVTQWAIRLQTLDFYGPSAPTPNPPSPP